MMKSMVLSLWVWCSVMLTAAAAAAAVSEAQFDPLKHLGGNGQWFPGPDIWGLGTSLPASCGVEKVAFLARHGSRFPDEGAWEEWLALGEKIHAANFTTSAPELQFLHSWQPILKDPARELTNLSRTGHAELSAMGTAFRARYPTLHPSFALANSSASSSNITTHFSLFANAYAPSPRVLDSARLFAQAYLSPNKHTSPRNKATIYVLNATAPRPAFSGNSLAPTDACPPYVDNGGGAQKEAWDAIWAPRAAERLNGLLTGDLRFGMQDVSTMAYLCGFESQILGAVSSWCGVLTREEVRAYERAQDLRYWFGSGPANGVGMGAMRGMLGGVVGWFEGQSEVGVGVKGRGGMGIGAQKLLPLFANDGQIAQMVAALGVFSARDDPSVKQNSSSLFRASHFVTMRGTVALELWDCAPALSGNETGFVRVLLNDAPYPLPYCAGGPGQTCALHEMISHVEAARAAEGGFRGVCGLGNEDEGGDGAEEAVPFFEDVERGVREGWMLGEDV